MDFIRKLPSHTDYPCVLASCDVVSLCTSIPYKLGLVVLSYWIDKKWNQIWNRFTKALFIEEASFVLSNNNFQFDSYMILQLVGTAMVTRFAPPYACIYVGYLEKLFYFHDYYPWILHKLNESWLKKYLNALWTIVLYYDQKMLTLIYLESF